MTPYRLIDTFLLLILIGAIFFFSFFSYDLIGMSERLWFLNRALVDTATGFEYEFLTANFAHFDMHHALENVLALVLIWYLFFNSYIDTALHKITLLFIPMLGTTFGVYLFDTVSVYGGMSGALHGMASGAALIRFIENKEFKAFAVLVAIVVKVIIDYKLPALSFNNLSQSLYGENLALNLNAVKATYSVSASSHLAGAITGCLTACLLLIAKTIKPKQIS